MNFLQSIVNFISGAFYFGIVFSISYTISIFYLFNAFVPLLYLPYVSYRIIKKELKPSSLLNCIIAPIIWNILFALLFGLSFFLAFKFTLCMKLVNIVLYSPAGILGGTIALITVFFNMFSAQAREEFISGLEEL